MFDERDARFELGQAVVGDGVGGGEVGGDVGKGGAGVGREGVEEGVLGGKEEVEGVGAWGGGFVEVD